VPLRIRDMTTEEVETIRRLAHSRTETAGIVERAHIILLAKEGKPRGVGGHGTARVKAIAHELGVCAATVRLWLKRFNVKGLGGLLDNARPGRPAVYTAGEISEVIAASLTDPKTLGLPFASWTMDRLQAYLNEQKGIGIKRSRIGEILLDEGLRWRKQETWFGERVDPEFAEKRGLSRSCIPTCGQEA